MALYQVPWVGLRCVIVVFPDHNHLLLFWSAICDCVISWSHSHTGLLINLLQANLIFVTLVFASIVFLAMSCLYRCNSFVLII